MNTADGRVRARGLRSMVAWTLAALAVQFLLGMLVNLFVHIPASHPGAQASYFAGVPQVVAWAIGSGVTALRLHVALGVALFFGGIAILVLAIRSGQRAWVWSASVGMFGLFSAAGNGASFLIYNQDFSSFFMSIGFIIAVAAYAVGIYVMR